MRIIEKTKQFLNIEKGKIKRDLLRLVLAAPFWIVIASLVIIAIGVGRAIYLTDTRPDQYVAEQWQRGSETSFRHMVAFAGGIRASGDTSPMIYAEGGKSIHLGDLPQIRTSLQGAADTGTGASGKKISGSSDKHRGWEECYSSSVRGTLTAVEIDEGLRKAGATADTEIVAVGGNYQAFHTFRFLSGGFLPETPVDTYQIVINDVVAWKFFRSYDVTGRMIEINGKLFTIIGVVEEKNTKVAELAGEQQNRAFIYFSALGSLFGGDSGTVPEGSSGGDDFGGDFGGSDFGGGSSRTSAGGKDYAIQCYEAMLPELVNGVAVSDFKNAMPNYSITNPQILVVNDPGRFSIFRVVDTVFPLGETDKERLGYEFPYWEIATQMTESRLFYDYVITAFGILLCLIGVIMLALKFRAKKAVAPEELEVPDTAEKSDTESSELMLKE